LQIKAKTADLILCPSIDSDRVITYELEKNDLAEDATKMSRRDTSHLYIQSALLYSTSDGQRRIRVHNLAIPLTNMKNLPFEYMDVNATVHFFARVALNRVRFEIFTPNFLVNDKRQLPGNQEHGRNVYHQHLQGDAKDSAIKCKIACLPLTYILPLFIEVGNNAR